MTFKEKLQMELPNKICKGVPSACPTTYGYEKREDRPCKGKGLIDSAFCDGCWNREMPNTETKSYNQNLRERIIEEIYHAIDSDRQMCIGADIQNYLLKVLEDNMDYNKGLNDAWELSRKLLVDFKDVTGTEFLKIFGAFIPDVYSAMTPQEALAKMKAYEEQKVLTRGDEVICLDTDEKAIFFGKNEGSEEGWFLMKDYNVPQRIMLNTVKKTGKHIDCLEQIGE